MQALSTRRSRLSSLVVAVWLCLLPRVGNAEPATIVIDRARVVELVSKNDPNGVVARTRIGEARALKVGSQALAPTNPELGVFGGPRRLNDTKTTVTDFGVVLTWPIDFSGARSTRGALARERIQAADAEANDARRLGLGEALDLWVRALGANARAELETERVKSDAALVKSAQAHRDAGVTGDSDVALATVIEASSQARLKLAVGEREALLALLRERLGIDPDASVAAAGSLDASAPPSLTSLVAVLAKRPDILRAAAQSRAGLSDAEFQRRLGVPLPRVSLGGGRDPDYYARVGVEVPLPIYQTNQTHTAVARAHADTAKAELAAVVARAGAQLRAAYATYLGARDALMALDGAGAAIDDADHLALRAYELGHSNLGALALARRETFSARAARLDARIAVARARIALDEAAGLFR